ncbi:hypothetical protein CSKR_101896 [Clonorchis sinensis]|uniref:UPF0506 domain-containing protein n=1 Tax=Clonorchis sinensis TaxID=79923 RepID=A0A8T1MH32_CLOSI|nr:hypothetical protein CSKR_101896 [Clonorchis sinensis]
MWIGVIILVSTIMPRLYCSPLGASGASQESCSGVGALCVWTPLNTCCDGLVCELQGPIYGRCGGCLSAGNFCVNDQQCCNSKCYYFACL